MMWWAVFCTAAALADASAAAPALASDIAPLPPLDLVQIDPPAPDDESLSYAVPSTGGRYAVGSPWLYFLADESRDSQGGRLKRRMPALSIELPMSVLRQKLTLEKERRGHALRAAANRQYLNTIGKRGLQRIIPSFRSGRY